MSEKELSDYIISVCFRHDLRLLSKPENPDLIGIFVVDVTEIPAKS